jgi:hypothetical protein
LQQHIFNEKKDLHVSTSVGQRYLVWRGRTARQFWFQLVKTKPELGLVFGTRFGTGASFSVLSKNQNPDLGFLKGKKIGKKD